MRILLVAGGWSPEREVSLSGARVVEDALRQLGHDVLRYDPSDGWETLPAAASQADAAFLNLHGKPGEDGLIQAMLDVLGLPYQGSGPVGSQLALDKAAAKTLVRTRNIPTPPSEHLPTPPAADYSPNIDFPLFVKPNLGGSSLGMARLETPDQLAAALAPIFAAGQEVLLEQAVDGMEITCAVLGQGDDARALPPIVILPGEDATFFDYDSKYIPGRTREICPPPPELAGDATIALVQDHSVAVHKLLGLSGVSRSDFILDTNNQPWFLEVNTLPGMTATSLVPQSAAAAGLSFAQLVAELLAQATGNPPEQDTP